MKSKLKRFSAYAIAMLMVMALFPMNAIANESYDDGIIFGVGEVYVLESEQNDEEPQNEYDGHDTEGDKSDEVTNGYNGNGSEQDSEDYLHEEELDSLELFDIMPLSTGTFNLANGTGIGAGTQWNFNNATGVVTILHNADVTIIGSVTNGRRIEIAPNATATVTLNNVSITGQSGTNQSPLLLNNGVNLRLTLIGTNTLTASSNRAAVEVTTGRTLTIDGAGTLNANGGSSGAGIGGGAGIAGGNITIEGGIVNATGASSGGNSAGAGIGGGGSPTATGPGGAGGNVTIINGVVNATSHFSGGAGIGGGGGRTGGGGGTTNIQGGVVTAQGSTGIGGGGGDLAGAGGAGGTIFISGGDITAAGRQGAGIGGGANNSIFVDNPGPGGAGGSITITGGIINATSGSGGGAGIGGGGGPWNIGGIGGNITISGGTIDAIGSGGAGIGGGNGNTGGVIVIEGTASVTARGRFGSAGIGGGTARHVPSPNGGVGGAGGNITIRGNATVNAFVEDGNGNGAGIGGGGGGSSWTNGFAGFGGAGGTITIGGNAVVVADARTSSGTAGAAGIGGGSAGPTFGTGGTPGVGGASGTITISNNAQVTATGNWGGAGIGGGNRGNSDEISIIGGAVNATGGNQGAGIGGGGQGFGGIINILNASVTATGGAGAAGIGGGAGGWGAGGNITIDNSAIIARAGNNSASAIGAGANPQGGNTVVDVAGNFIYWTNTENVDPGGQPTGEGAFTNNSAYSFVRLETEMPLIVIVTSVSANPATLTSTGGSSTITVTGSNLVPTNVRIAAFLNNTGSALYMSTPTGNASSVSSALTFPANTGTTSRSYTIRASINGGSTWLATPVATVTVNAAGLAFFANDTPNPRSQTANVTAGAVGRVQITVTNNSTTTRTATIVGAGGSNSSNDPTLWNSTNTTQLAWPNSFQSFNFTHTVTLNAGQSFVGFAGTAGNVARSYAVTVTWPAADIRSISLTAGTMTFPAATVGYAQPAAITTTITNTGNVATGQLTVTAPTGFQVSTSQTTGFANSIDVASIAVGVTDTFWTRPVTGLTANTHTGNVTVENTSVQSPPLTAQAKEVSFTVNPIGTPPGAGTATNPWRISTSAHLQWIMYSTAIMPNLAQRLSGHYVLENNITAPHNFMIGCQQINRDSSFYRPGIHVFTGIFDGSGNTITLSISRPAEYDIGLFREIGVNAVVRNLTVTGSVTGRSRVGGLIGTNHGGSVNDSSSTVDVMSTGTWAGGGLVGFNTNSSSSQGTIVNSSATGTVTGASTIGGLVGDNRGAILSSYAGGAVGSGIVGTSGLHAELVPASYVITPSSGNEGVGNWVRLDAWDDSNDVVIASELSIIDNIELSKAPAIDLALESLEGVDLTEGVFATSIETSINVVGGLVGQNGGIISNSYATGDVLGDDMVGGLVGNNGVWGEGRIEHSHASGNITGNRDVGGLVGRNTGTVITDSHFAGSVTGITQVGGLTGINLALIEDSYSIGAVSGNVGVGGLVGQNDGTVTNCFATGNVTGTAWYTGTGGLVGVNMTGTVTNSFASGDVMGFDIVGGLVGSNRGAAIIANSYAIGDVEGTRVGGLVGTNSGVITNSFAASVGLQNSTPTVGEIGTATFTLILSPAQDVAHSLSLNTDDTLGIALDAVTNSSFAIQTAPITPQGNHQMTLSFSAITLPLGLGNLTTRPFYLTIGEPTALNYEAILEEALSDLLQTTNINVVVTDEMIKGIPSGVASGVFASLDVIYEIKNADGTRRSDNIPVGTGTVIEFENGTELTVVVFGDVSGTGRIGGTDVQMLRMYLAGHPSVPSIIREAADFRGIGSIGGIEVQMLRMYLASHPAVPSLTPPALQ